MNKSAKNFREAWNHAKAFLENAKETYLKLSVDTTPQKSHYYIVKLSYGKNIYMLYSLTVYHTELWPGLDLKYSGFYNKNNGQAYDIREPLNHFIGFDSDYIHEVHLKKMVITAIQRSVAKYIASHAEEFSGIPITDIGDVTGDAEQAFSKKETILDFAKKINITEWQISNRDMVDYVDNPDSFLNSKADQQIKGREEEFSRLWAAHCASQKILDQLYSNNSLKLK